jgi:hypothetical protein
LPDAFREWSLDRRERRARGVADGVRPVTTCGQCSAVYERVFPACPYCSHRNEPAARSAPQYVDGDLAELDAATLAAMRGDVERIDAPWQDGRAPSSVVESAMRKAHSARQSAQAELRATLERYGGWRTECGDPLAVAQRRFYLTFGVDVLSAQTLGAREASDLRDRVAAALPKDRSFVPAESQDTEKIVRAGLTDGEIRKSWAEATVKN